jgi:hypothetical protein
MKTTIVVTLLAAALSATGLAAALSATGGISSASAGEPCNPAGNLSFVCGPLNSEDLV